MWETPPETGQRVASSNPITSSRLSSGSSSSTLKCLKCLHYFNGESALVSHVCIDDPPRHAAASVENSAQRPGDTLDSVSSASGEESADAEVQVVHIIPPNDTDDLGHSGDEVSAAAAHGDPAKQETAEGPSREDSASQNLPEAAEEVVLVPNAENPPPSLLLACSVCAKTFARRYSLDRHMRMHNDIRPFPCDECGLRFRQRYQLTAHARLHTGDKPFACEECGECFVTSTRRSHHYTKEHASVKPFTCDSCDRFFVRKDHYTRHMKNHNR